MSFIDSLPLLGRNAARSSPWLKAHAAWQDGERNRPRRRHVRPKIYLLCAGGILTLLLFVSVTSTGRHAASAALDKAGIVLDEEAIPDLKGSLQDQWDKLAEAGLPVGRRPEDKVEDLYANAGAMRAGWSREGTSELSTSTENSDNAAFLSFLNNGYALLPGKTPKTAPQHPILTLIDKAQTQWEDKVRRQSQTLSAAVKEYQRRYHRNPPRGFDKWWAYATKNKVVLKDEYDQIDRDLRVFWALEPKDLRWRMKQMRDRDETFTITIDPDGELLGGKTVNYHGPEAGLQRALDLGELIRRFAGELPSTVDLTFTKQDQPACMLSYGHKSKMLEMATQGEYFGLSDYVDTSQKGLSNWANACAPASPLRASETGQFDTTATFQHHSFIHDHQQSMDICLHPENMALHGYTSTAGTDPGELVPLFTFAKTNLHSDILATPLEQYSDSYIGEDISWSKKPISRLLWRGSTTGADFVKGVQWKDSQRARMHFLGHTRQGKKDVLWADSKGQMQQKRLDVKVMNQKYLDTSFSGTPLQCDPPTCKLMDRLIDFEPTMGLEEANQYKYVLDLDGNGWSGRFHRLMSSNSMVIKSSIFPEWYADHIMPWVHYVPLKVDYKDLYDIMAFFIGTPEGKNGHDAAAEKIATAGRQWTKKHWRREDMAAYMYRLVLEWTRVVNRDTDEELDFVQA